MNPFPRHGQIPTIDELRAAHEAGVADRLARTYDSRPWGWRGSVFSAYESGLSGTPINLSCYLDAHKEGTS